LRNKNKKCSEPDHTPEEEGSHEKEPKIHVAKETIIYIQTVTTLIEQRPVSIEEIIIMLKNRMRQHSIDRSKRFMYPFHYPQEKPK
jgi:hypothetical protein